MANEVGAPHPHHSGTWPDRRDASAPSLDVTVGLSRREHWILGRVRQRGVTRFVAELAAIAVLASLTLVVAIVIPVYGDEPSFLVPALIMGGTVPALVAPPMLFFGAGLVERLDRAAHLVRETALTDPLTGVLNRRGFFEELRATQAADQAIEVGMVDLDDFKQLNDQHGHAAGDRALCGVAEWLVDLVGADGTVARIGGDEFAYMAAADPRRSVPSKQSFASNGVACSATIGKVICGAGENPERALVRADADLYLRKADRQASASSVKNAKRPGTPH